MSEWVKAAEVSRCPPGNHLGVVVSGNPIMLANVDGDLYALRDVCSHQDFPLSDGEMEGTEIECIYHGATFDVCTGKATGLPAVAPVKVYEVEVRDGDIFVQV
jgi:3-phenylpropionate/trans-cinnamate dioxygenase ferredoxin subunit